MSGAEGVIYVECGAPSHTSLFFVSFCQANYKQPPFHYYTSTVNEDHPSFQANTYTSDTTCLTNVQMTALFLSRIKVSLGKKEEDVFTGREGGTINGRMVTALAISKSNQ